MIIRQMTYDDVPTVERLTAAAFYGVDVATADRRPSSWPPPALRSPERAVRWVDRLRHLVSHDGPGCWVAAEDGRIVGAVAALLREGGWGLSTFAVEPGLQGRGIGRQLLDAAIGHGPWTKGIICSSWDPRAVHRYQSAGFEMHPARLFWGPAKRDAIPAVSHVRSGWEGDVDLLDAIDRSARGFGRGADHRQLLAQFPVLIHEDKASRGYAYHFPNGSPYLLAATDDAAASAVLWAALAAGDGDEPVEIDNVTEHQRWAVEIAESVGLDSIDFGYVGIRGMPAPEPYLPSGHFL